MMIESSPRRMYPDYTTERAKACHLDTEFVHSIPMKKNNSKLQLKKVTIRVLPPNELTNIFGGTCLEPTRGVQCAALVYQDQEK
jgi:hypothetical protein